jgi:hypothetical protein
VNYIRTPGLVADIQRRWSGLLDRTVGQPKRLENDRGGRRETRRQIIGGVGIVENYLLEPQMKRWEHKKKKQQLRGELYRPSDRRLS